MVYFKMKLKEKASELLRQNVQLALKQSLSLGYLVDSGHSEDMRQLLDQVGIPVKKVNGFFCVEVGDEEYDVLSVQGSTRLLICQPLPGRLLSYYIGIEDATDILRKKLDRSQGSGNETWVDLCSIDSRKGVVAVISARYWPPAIHMTARPVLSPPLESSPDEDLLRLLTRRALGSLVNYDKHFYDRINGELFRKAIADPQGFSEDNILHIA